MAATEDAAISASTLSQQLQQEVPSRQARWKSTKIVHEYESNQMDSTSYYQGSASAPAPALNVNMTSKYMENSIAPATADFPSLIIKADKKIEPHGSFAEAQAVYLDPDPEAVDSLVTSLVDTNMGIVAHYYMDVELQGILQAANARTTSTNEDTGVTSYRVGIADSLKMGDMAVEMVENAGCEAIVCLGVDFMSESVQAILAQKGYGHIPVYRAAAPKIGCSLAESAETSTYRAWLQHAAQQQQNALANVDVPHKPSTQAETSPLLHVVYINTSLETKAVSNTIVPTITCTSSNVLGTILQASTQVPNLKIMYGPDTYMGQNLVTFLTMLLEQRKDGSFVWDDKKIASDLHPEHNRESLARLRDSIDVFPAGNCVVHHMFGGAVTEKVQQEYAIDEECFVTAHLEVPGEMFKIAMKKSLTDQGVVGSTSDILTFIARKVKQEATNASSNPDPNRTPRRLKFILGTEAGMVSSIVQSVQAILQESNCQDSVEAEIIFPVAQDAVMATPEDDTNMPLVPGVSGGEGCSTAGGCATCPFMKMNDYDAVLDILEMVSSTQQHVNDKSNTDYTVTLTKHLPPQRLAGKSIGGRPAVEVGSEPILYMREFSKTKKLPESLVDRILKQQQQLNVKQEQPEQCIA